VRKEPIAYFPASKLLRLEWTVTIEMICAVELPADEVDRALTS
jgi:hypothetical protein